MKNITKIIAVASMLVLAIPSVGFAHGNSNSDDHGDRSGIFAKTDVRGDIKTDLKDVSQDRADVKNNDNDGDHFNLMANENVWMGTVTAKGTNTVTIRLPEGAVFTVNTSGATFVAHQGTTFSFSDIQINDKLFVAGTINGSTVTATKLFDISLPNHKARIKGTVSATNSTNNSFTVITQSGRTVTVNTDGNTVVKQNGSVVAVSNVAVNSSVIVRGTWSATALDAMIASKILIK